MGPSRRWRGRAKFQGESTDKGSSSLAGLIHAAQTLRVSSGKLLLSLLRRDWRKLPDALDASTGFSPVRIIASVGPGASREQLIFPFPDFSLIFTAPGHFPARTAPEILCLARAFGLISESFHLFICLICSRLSFLLLLLFFSLFGIVVKTSWGARVIAKL